MADKKERVKFIVTPESFIKAWVNHDADKKKLTEVFGGVSVDSISNYASFLRKQGVNLPRASRGVSTRAPIDAAQVAKLNKLLEK